jgi:hypothetical protein
MPVLAPFCRKQKDFTGGRLRLRGVGRISSFRALRAIPVWGHNSPGGGSLRNSGRVRGAEKVGGISTGSDVLAGFFCLAFIVCDTKEHRRMASSIRGVHDELNREKLPPNHFSVVSLEAGECERAFFSSSQFILVHARNYIVLAAPKGMRPVRLADVFPDRVSKSPFAFGIIVETASSH